MADKLFYLQNSSAGYLGNSPLFWKRGGNGYTQWIDDAELFTLSEIHKITDSTKSHTWEVWSKEIVERNIKIC